MRLLTLPVGLTLAAAVLLMVIIVLAVGLVSVALYYWIGAGIEIAKEIESWLISLVP